LDTAALRGCWSGCGLRARHGMPRGGAARAARAADRSVRRRPARLQRAARPGSRLRADTHDTPPIRKSTMKFFSIFWGFAILGAWGGLVRPGRGRCGAPIRCCCRCCWRRVGPLQGVVREAGDLVLAARGAALLRGRSAREGRAGSPVSATAAGQAVLTRVCESNRRRRVFGVLSPGGSEQLARRWLWEAGSRAEILSCSPAS
jgi:hypothetical protein